MRKYFTKQYVKEKKLRSSYFKYKNLEKISIHPLKKLDIPIQRGWNMELTINSNLKKNLYDWIYTCVVYFSKEYQRNNCLKMYIRNIKKLREFKYLKNINKETALFPIKSYVVYNYELNNFISKFLNDYYYDDRYFYFIIKKSGKYTTVEIYLKQEFVKTKIVKNLITEIPDIDPILLQEKAELYNDVENYWKYNYDHYKRSAWDRLYKNEYLRKKYNKQ